MSAVAELITERGMPESVESEQAILGSVLLSADAYISTITNGLVSQDFSLDSHRRIFAVMGMMGEAGRHIDLITLSEELKRSRQLESVGGITYLSSLTNGLPVRRDLRAYVRTVREKARQRKLIHGFNAGIGAVLDGSSAQECIDTVNELFLQIQSDSDEAPAERVIKFSDSVCNDWLQMADSNAELLGLTTGLGCLDLATTGLRPGELWLAAGRVGDGKSALALQMAAANLRHDVPVGLFSLEMSKAEILHRLWSQQGKIPFHLIRDPRRMNSEMRMRVRRAMADVGTWPLFVQDGSLSIHRLIAKARLLVRQEGIKLLIIDYLQIVAANAKDERERLTRISNAVRELAKSEGIAVLAVSQLNRPRDGSLNARPNKFSLKESGSLEADAHTILLTYRPVDGADQPTYKDYIVVAKQRHGPVGHEPVYFDSATLTFRQRTEVPQC